MGKVLGGDRSLKAAQKQVDKAASLYERDLLKGHPRSSKYNLTGVALRRSAIFVELIVVFAICFVGFQFLVSPVRELEITFVVAVCHLLGATGISGILPEALVITPPGEVPIIAAFTASCSSLLAILALGALAATILRGRKGHTILAFFLAASLVFVANGLRIVAISLAGLHYGTSALILFHDWAGTILNFAYTFVGLLVMIHFTLPNAARAEQDKSGRHTARRPTSWARQGLGYRMEEVRPKAPSYTIMSKFIRILPKSTAKRIASKREANRIDYRLGHMEPAARAVQVRKLSKDGLATHIATLLAVASYEEDLMVLDTLAEVVASKQWEPITSDKVSALRLWARAWTLRPIEPSNLPSSILPPALDHTVIVTGAGGPAGVTVIRSLISKGYTVVGVDADPSAVGFHLATQGVTLPFASDAAYPQALLEVVRTYRPEALICTVAEEYGALIPLSESLSNLGCKTWFPDLEAALDCTDKVRFAERLTAANILHPVTVYEAKDLGEVPGPWVVKPKNGRGSRDVILVDESADLVNAFLSVPDAICQTRIIGAEFTADALVDRTGRLVTCVPRWRSEVKAGISVKGETFDSADVTAAVEDTLSAVGLTGPANVQGFVADDGTVTIIEVNPRFSGGLPLTVAAGADVIGAYLAGILDPGLLLPELTFVPGTKMARHYAEVFITPAGDRLPDPFTMNVASPNSKGTFATMRGTK